MADPPNTLRELGVALNEARLVALDVDESAAQLDLRMDVLALAAGADGPPDRRRTVRLAGVDRVRAAVRVGGLLGAVAPLASSAALSRLVADLRGETILLGGDFIDDSEHRRRGPSVWSLDVALDGSRAAHHDFSWSIDAIRGDGRRIVFDLAVDFAELVVLDADGAILGHGRMLAEARHFWGRLAAGDSVAVFVRDSAPGWRDGART